MGKVNIDSLRSLIESQTGCTCDVYPEIGNDDTLIIPPERLQGVVALLNDYFEGIHLSTITAQQRETRGNAIEVIYHFYQDSGFSLMITLPEQSPELASVVSIIPGADFYEREVAEMFGVKFTGRDETPPLLLPEDWDQGPPFIRKEDNDE
ncbi:MAG: NADH-quinone oxidoreductase subunit C [Chloroflexota bacterium]|nr:NADH-quinone oxidoreductase subunit C [Chloroflexota bacterium]